MKAPARRRVALVATAAALTGLTLSGCRAALPPGDPSTPASFGLTKIATIPGAAFTVTGELAGGPSSQEIVTSNFAFNGRVPLPGGVSLTRKVDGAWTTSSIVTAADGIIGPNKPTISDVNGDGRNDVIVPSGFFFGGIAGPPPGLATGSISWWENTPAGTFLRRDVVTGKLGSYHSVAHTDVDGDGKKDLLTTFEDGGHPAWPFGSPIAPTVRTEYLKGLGGGSFAAPVTLADGGGSLPVVADINLDGKPDIVTAQYFKVKSSAIAPFGITADSFVWFERTGSAADGLTATDFTKHVIATGLGESFQIIPVDNIDGDGKYGAIGINHVNPAIPGSAAPQVVRLTPGADIRAPWTVTPVASGFTLDNVTTGQAAPGGASDGDLDGDGDVDLALSGDADWSMYWIERKGDGSWVKHDLAVEAGLPATTNWGQGSTAIADVDRDGRNDLVFASFNAGELWLAQRVPGTGGSFPAVPRVADPLLRY